MPKYYAKLITLSFPVPLRDEDGKTIAELDGNGNQKYNGNRKLVKTKLCKFQPEVYGTKRDATGYVCSYTTGRDKSVLEKDEIEILERMAADRLSPAMTEKEYKQKYRPVDIAQEEAQRFREEADAAKAEAEKWRAEVEKLRGEGAKRGPGRPPKDKNEAEPSKE